MVVTHNALTQLDMHLHRLTFVVNLVDNAFSSRILFNEVWDGVERGANTKIRRVKVQNDIRTSIHINTQTSPIFDCDTPVGNTFTQLNIPTQDLPSWFV